MDLIVSKKTLRFVSENKLDFTQLKCSKIRQIGGKWECIIPIPSNSLLGVQIFNIKLPTVENIEIHGTGLHTKVLIDDVIFDHFEIGGPLKINLEYSFKIRGKTRGDATIKVALPNDSKNQKITSIKCNHPFEELNDKEGNKIAEIWVPKRSLEKQLELKFNITLETNGFDIYHTCLDNVCKIIKTEPKELDVMDSDLSNLLSKIQLENSLLRIITEVYKYLQRKVKYRVNYEKFGWTYALKMGFGACDEISDLTVKILRATGIQAKYVRGLHIKGENSVIGHAWVEILTDEGLLPIDPTAKIFGVGMSWIKILASEKSTREIIQLPKGLKLIGIKHKII